MLLASLWYGDVQQTGFPSDEDFMTYTLHRHTPFLARRPGMVHIAISEAIIISEIDKPGDNTTILQSELLHVHGLFSLLE